MLWTLLLIAGLSSWLLHSILTQRGPIINERMSWLPLSHSTAQLFNPLLHGAVRFSPPFTRDTGLSSYRHSTSHVTWTASLAATKAKKKTKWWINDGFFCCQRRILNHQKLVDVKMWILLLSCVDINDFRSSLTSGYTVDASDIRLLTRWGWKFISLFTTCLSHIPGQVIPSFQFWSPETDRFFQKSPSELGFNHLAVHSCQHPMGYVESYQTVCRNVDSQTLVTSSTTCTNVIWLEKKNSRFFVISYHVLSCPMFLQGKSSPSLDI